MTDHRDRPPPRRWACQWEWRWQPSCAARLLARKGMQNYNDLDTRALEAELQARKINWGMKKDPGKRRLLEDDDDREKLTDGAGKGKKKMKEKRKRKGGSAGSAGRRGKKAKAGKKTRGQGRGRARRNPKRSQGAAGCSGGRPPGKSARRDSRRINSR